MILLDIIDYCGGATVYIGRVYTGCTQPYNKFQNVHQYIAELYNSLFAVLYVVCILVVYMQYTCEYQEGY